MEAKLFIGIMYNDEHLCKKVINKLTDDFGPVEQESEPYLFNFTNYYEDEMGLGLWKKFVVFRFLINKKDLAKIKLFTNNIEDRYRIREKRQANLDPGYLTEEEVVLASVKGGENKFDIGKGLFGHKIYEFKNDEIKTIEHTFPEFKSSRVKEFFLDLRNNLPTKHSSKEINLV